MGLFDKLGFGLKKTKDGIFNSITKTIISSPLTDELYDELLEQLILADVGYEVSEYLCEELRREARKRKAKSGEDVVAIFQDIVVDLLSTDREFDLSGSPAVHHKMVHNKYQYFLEKLLKVGSLTCIYHLHKKMGNG